MKTRLPPCRRFLLVTLLVVLGRPTFAADQPNILWLTSEDHGIEMGCYGDALARTPNVDALAAKGMLFKHAWSVHPVCAPARSAIISGLYSTSSGSVHMRSMVPMPAGAKMYPQFLREAGYHCTNNSKEDYSLRKPAGTWDDSSASAHWRNRRAGQPFFAIFNSTRSHESQIRTRPHRQIASPAAIRVPAYHPDTPEVRQDWAQYYDKVSEADADAGARLKEIEAAGLAADTIVFYYGDHGSGMPRSKRWPSNSGLHVPMVVFFPDKWRHLAPKEYQPGGRSDRMVSFVDLAPTVLSLAGVRPPAGMQGHAFAGPHQTPPPPFLYGARGRMDECQDSVRSVTDGRYVYLRNYYPHVSQAQHVDYQFQTPTTRIWREWYDQRKTNAAQSLFWQTPKAPEELYDLQTDRDEVKNLAGSPAHRAILEKLRAAQRAHVTQVRDVCFLPEGEIHSRSQGSSPYDMARDDAKYPFQRIFDAADLASNLDPAALPRLTTLIADADSAVRYWAALGFLMRGPNGVTRGQGELRTALTDSSPYVRIVAAQALAQHGPESDLPATLALLGELAPPERNGVFVAMSALSAIQALGPKAASLRELVRTMKPAGPSPDERFNSYVPRLIANIAPPPPGSADSSAAKAKGKGKKKKNAEK
ncbi:MAG: sulfatase-like hydrolase/transferase [Verrucomicrobia bacterium]|nr:sulfatase-like hydrolase/transferase [Verrucomicrobiota bacterium]